VIIPTENQKDLEEVPIEARSHMIFAPVDRIDQVLRLALEDPPPGEEGNGREPATGVDPGDETTSAPSAIESEPLVAKPRPRA
jgi:predicted ATP-dependent protease